MPLEFRGVLPGDVERPNRLVEQVALVPGLRDRTVHLGDDVGRHAGRRVPGGRSPGGVNGGLREPGAGCHVGVLGRGADLLVFLGVEQDLAFDVPGDGAVPPPGP